MDKIKILDAQLSNMIAAGEVVERPSSVVKELVENAIDAQATRIEVTVENAGRTYIEVRDNGLGMNASDLSKAILRHATSKINDEYDLFRIKTLGFRGEALPSIASVAHLTIVACDGTGPGHVLESYEGVVKTSTTSARQGTVVTVRNLFFNTPARLKFLKNDYIETSHILDGLTRLAMGHPHIAFQVIIDGQKSFTTDGRGEPLNVLTQIFGKETTSQIIPFQWQDYDVTVTGFLGLPSLAKSHRYGMYTLVNGRAVSLYKINQACLEAYKPFLPPVRFPWLFLQFQVDPSLVDVNVHPTKREVRLSKEEAIKTGLIQAIQTTLKQANLSPSYRYDSPISPTNESSSKHANSLKIEEPLVESIPLGFEASSTKQALTVVAQLHLTYLVCRDEQGSIYLIDQHAADERVRYEQLLRLYEEEKFKATPLVPVMIDVKPSDAKLLTNERLLQLEAIGVELVAFGANAYKVQSVPVWALSQAQTYVEDLLQQLFHEPLLTPDKLRLYAIASKACKTSIKAQDALSLTAMQSLVDRLLQCQFPYTCPHGRPTMVQFAKRQLEAMFNRSGF
jgi:DNA mismatch repair protein MutL